MLIKNASVLGFVSVAISLGGCAPSSPVRSTAEQARTLPSLAGALSGWSVYWLDEPIRFDPDRDLVYDLRRVGDQWVLAMNADLTKAEVERVRLSSARRWVVLMARPSPKRGADGGRSLCRYGTAASKEETDRALAGYNHCTTNFGVCSSTVGVPGLAKACYMSLDKVALIAAINQAGVGDRYAADRGQAEDRARLAQAEAAKARADASSARRARQFRGAGEASDTVVRVDLTVDDDTAIPPRITLYVTASNATTAPIRVSKRPASAITLSDGATYVLATNVSIDPRERWTGGCVVDGEYLWLNPGQRCSHEQVATIPGVTRGSDLASGRALAPRSIRVFERQLPLSPVE